ncbi:hypothetical protein KP509_13G044900 [Ceratopteris richardii]|uniref:Uncharacterized protein n=1 Tax=Ceratopteris richardii TaxID=49495 RepID=A0A8T2TIE5_CERRI|nr:hypothetical protein KP509_13G044900 [Ceratopteris richardii]
MIDHSTTSILSMASSSSLSSVATFASSYPTSLDHLSWKLCSPNPLSALFPIGRTKSHLRDSKEGFIRACNHSSQAHGTDILMTRRGTFTAAMFLTTASGKNHSSTCHTLKHASIHVCTML